MCFSLGQVLIACGPAGLSCFYNQRQAAFEAAAMPLGFICEARLYPTWLFLELAGKEIRPDSVPSNQGARMASTF